MDCCGTSVKQTRNSLDRYEGVAGEHYRKLMIPVRRTDGCVVQALVYVASSNELGTAQPGYMEKIIRAATDHMLPTECIEELKSWLVTNDRNT